MDHDSRSARVATSPETCASALVETIPQLMRVIRQEMRSHAAPALSVPQVRTLAFLNRTPGASLGSLAAHLGVTAPTASTLADRLVQQGLVARLPDPDERRRVTLTLTDAGAHRFQQTRLATRAQIAAKLGGLSDAQLATVEETLMLLGRVLLTSGVTPSSPSPSEPHSVD
jgi:DNA-binding MarR family transcriptional regulator